MKTSRIRSCLECLFLLLIVAPFTLNGCGGTSTPPPEEQAVASQAKSQIDEFVELAMSDQKKAATESSILLESLEGLANEYGEPYVAIFEQGKVVEQKYQSNASKSEIEAELKKLQDLASAPAPAE